VQTEEQRQKMDEVSELVVKFSEFAHHCAQKFKVASEPFLADGGSFRIVRHKGTWELIWADTEGDWDLRAASVAVKRKFLVVAEEFFRSYLGMASSWEKAIDIDLEKGREALEEIRKLVP